MKSNKVMFVGVVLVFVFCFGFVSSYSCSVESSCSAANTVLKLSADTNAHGALYNVGSYGRYLCCDFTGTHSSSNGNKVLGLSGSNNGHAEIPSLSDYASNVYFGDLKCTSGSSCSGRYTIPMVSLSEDTNAHLGTFATYSTKVCCCAPGDWTWTSSYQCSAGGGEAEGAENGALP